MMNLYDVQVQLRNGKTTRRQFKAADPAEARAKAVRFYNQRLWAVNTVRPTNKIFCKNITPKG